ncbi:MAG TPA: hypothetical protein VN922_22725, partial [Bacteroidia bacterium]|nr:hypothetical protein [Bacteroidia bacterium]
MLDNFISYLTANKNKALVLLNLFFFLSITVFIGYAFSKNRFMVVEEDEAIYYNSARVFSETGSVRAFDCFDENTSKIGNSCWYGPMYSLLHGGIAKVVGLHKYSFLIFNLFCLALILLLVFRSGFTYTNKLLLSLGFLTSVPCLYYLFSYYPVTLDLLFSTVLILKLRKIYDKDLKNESVTGIKATFIAFILFFALFRVAIVFWVFGLLPFAKTKKQFIQTSLLSVGCVCVILTYIRLFNAPYHGFIMPVIFEHPFSP